MSHLALSLHRSFRASFRRSSAAGLTLLLVALLAPFGGRAQAAEATAARSAPSSNASDAVLAEVNGQPVYVEMLERRLGAMHSGISKAQRSVPNLDQLMFRLVNDTLLAQEARALGMDQDDSIRSQIETERRRLATKQLERDEIWKPAVATEQEIRSAYAQEYRRVTLRVITVYKEDEAKDLLAKLQGGADFAAVAKESSVDPYKLRGGLVEDLPKIDLQREIADVAFDQQPGKVFGPVRTDIGWSVIRVESFQAADQSKLDERESDIRDMVRVRKAESLRAALATKLRQKHPVTIDREALASIVPERQTDGRLLPKVAKPGAAVVRIGTGGNEVITAGELAGDLKFRWKGIRNEEVATAAMPILLEKKIEERLVQVEALARGLGDTPVVQRELDALETEKLVSRYLKEVVAKEVKIEPDEIRAYYDQHPDRFRRPPRVHVSQLTVADEKTAEDLKKMLAQGADFTWLARQHSIDRFKDQGGERGWLYPRPDTDSLSDQLLAASSGDVLGPLGGAGNWTLVRINSKESQDPYPFDQVSGNVRATLFQEKFSKVLDRFITTLRSRSEITIHEDVLGSLRITGRRDESEASETPAGSTGHGGHPG